MTITVSGVREPATGVLLLTTTAGLAARDGSAHRRSAQAAPLGKGCAAVAAVLPA